MLYSLVDDGEILLRKMMPLPDGWTQGSGLPDTKLFTIGGRVL